MCFTDSNGVDTSTGHFSPGPCNVAASAHCPYVPISKLRGVFQVHKSVVYVAQGPPLMRHNPSVRDSNGHITLENRIGSVCGFSSNVFLRERVISLQPDLSPI